MMAGYQYSIIHQSEGKTLTFRKHLLYICVLALINVALVHTTNGEGHLIVGYGTDTTKDNLLLKDKHPVGEMQDLNEGKTLSADYMKVQGHFPSLGNIPSHVLYKGVLPQRAETLSDDMQVAVGPHESDSDQFRTKHEASLSTKETKWSSPLHLNQEIRHAQEGWRTRGKRSDLLTNPGWINKNDEDDSIEKRRWNNRMSAWGKRAQFNFDGSDSQDWTPNAVKKWSSSFNAWGKRGSVDDNYAKKWASMDAWGKRMAGDFADVAKEYADYNKDHQNLASSMNAWGNRGRDQDQYTLDKRWAKSMNAWGKRHGVQSEYENAWDGSTNGALENDKRWAKSMNAWGKREDDSEFSDNDKKWAKSMSAWGKRDNTDDGNTDIDKRWAKSMSAWGKRDQLENVDSGNENNNKRWASSMNAWGKRNELSGSDDKRWSSTMNAWGKRSGLPENIGYDKKWRSSMNAWGKRSGDLTKGQLHDNEKRWPNTMSAWGKRDSGEKRWAKSMGAWGKRTEKKWGRNMGAWGKRDSDNDLDNERYKRSSSINSLNSQSPLLSLLKGYHNLKQMEGSEHVQQSGGQPGGTPSSSGDWFTMTNHDDNKQYTGSSASYGNENLRSKRYWKPSKHYWIKRTNFPFFGGPKRGWRGHELNVWGKRSWQGFNSWGKREDSAPIRYQQTGSSLTDKR